MRAAVRVLACASVATLSAAPAWAPGTGNDLVPDIPLGSHTVKLVSVASVAPDRLIDIEIPPDGSGRLFLVSPNGMIRILENGSLLPTPFYNVPSYRTDQGMTTMTFHPDFAVNRKLYIVTSEAPGSGVADYGSPQDDSATAYDNVLFEYLADATNPDVVDLGTERELLRVRQPHLVHSLNDLVFGDDGLLYIASGDGGNTREGTPTHYNTTGQQTNNPYGTILRIDVDQIGPNGRYAIPPDNPFAGGNVPEIYAWGLRNPWRLTKDRLTGELYSGVNGDFTIEQVFRIGLGENYGWDTREGSFLWDPVSGNASVDPTPDPQLVAPLAEYDHNNTDRAYGSVIGGHVYRGSRMPSLYGKYFLSDWVAGTMMLMDTATGALERVTVDASGVTVTGTITWGEDDDGELYLGTLGGALLRFELTEPGDTAGVVPSLTVQRAAGGDVRLDWALSCAPGDDDYEVYEGTLGDFTSHVPKLCTTGNQPFAFVTPSSGAAYFLVVPKQGLREGSYGTDGAGFERPVGRTRCLLQKLGACS